MGVRLFSPYSMSTPAEGCAVVGRDNEVNSILSNPGSVTIFGYSRWGKTTMLKALQAAAQKNGIDVLLVPECGDSDGALLRDIKMYATRVNAELGKAVREATDVENFLYSMSGFYQGSRAFVLLDETERLFGSEDTTRRFRSHIQEFTNLSFVLSIFPHVFADMQKATSRFKDVAPPVLLRPFEYDDTQKLAALCTDASAVKEIYERRKPLFVDAMPFSVDEEVYMAVHNMTGGFPYLIQGLMNEAIEHSNDTDKPEYITMDKLTSVYAEFSRMIQNQIAHLWSSRPDDRKSSLSKLQKTILAAVSQSPDHTRESLIKHCGEKNPSIFDGALSPIDAETGIGLIRMAKEGYVIQGQILRDNIAYFVEHFGV